MRAYDGPFRLVVFDVDGVLTDGTLLIDGEGETVKAFNVRDGLAVGLLHAHGLRVGVLSGKSSAALDYRIGQLRFDMAVTGKLEKRAAMAEILRAENLSAEQVAYVGDDVVDLPLAGVVGRFYAPADAHELVLEKADVVCRSKGGRGVAREVAEHMLREQGLSLEAVYAPLIGEWEQFHAVQ